MARNSAVSSEVEYYLDHIAAYDREFKQWENRVKKIQKKFRMDERNDKSPDQFNILWSNVQTMKAATYSRMPRPDVSRRFSDSDPVARVASLIVERALDFEVEAYPDFRMSMDAAVLDRYLGGRATVWVRYHPITKTIEPEISEQSDQEGIESSEPVEVLDFETCPVDYVHWADFGHQVARTWSEVNIVWRKVYLTRKEASARFENGDTLPLDASPNDDKKSDDSEGVQKRALVYEIWDKYKKEAIWLSKSLGKIIDRVADPLELSGFFPCPQPLYATLTAETLVPIPDYLFYQDQALKLDQLSERISGLIDALKVMGVYDASVPEIVRLFKEGQSGDLVPVHNWAALAEKQGLSGALDLVEIQPIAEALNQCYEAFGQIKEEIYEITGIGDILRGQGDAQETATAQQLKSNYASLRLKVYQEQVERFASEIYQIKAQIMCRHFEPTTLVQMASANQLSQADQMLLPQALQLLQDNLLRNFRVMVETDSMAYLDENQQKTERVQFLQAVGGFIQQTEAAIQSTPQLMPLAIELLKYGVAGFKVGKTLEGVIDQACEQLKIAAQQPKPNPEMMKLQGQQQIEQMKLQSQQQTAAAQMQHELQIEQIRAQSEKERESIRAQFEVQTLQHKLQADAALEAQKERLEMETDLRDKQHQAELKSIESQQQIAVEQHKADIQAQLEAQRLEFDKWKSQLEAETKIAVAEISAKSSLVSAQISADTAKETTAMGTKSKEKIASVPGEKQAEGESAITTALAGLKEALETMSKPKTVIRGDDGRIIGVK